MATSKRSKPVKRKPDSVPKKEVKSERMLTIVQPVNEAGLISVPEAAARIGVSDHTMWRMVLAQQIESLKIRGLRRIRLEALEKFLNTQIVPAVRSR